MFLLEATCTPTLMCKFLTKNLSGYQRVSIYSSFLSFLPSTMVSTIRPFAHVTFKFSKKTFLGYGHSYISVAWASLSLNHRKLLMTPGNSQPLKEVQMSKNAVSATERHSRFLVPCSSTLDISNHKLIFGYS